MHRTFYHDLAIWNEYVQASVKKNESSLFKFKVKCKVKGVIDEDISCLNPLMLNAWW